MSETLKEAEARGVGPWFVLSALSFLWQVVKHPVKLVRALLGI